MKYIFYIIFFIVMGCSCSSDITYSEVVHFKNQEWISGESADFVLPVNDTIQQYKLNFLLLHTHDYPYSNLFFLIKTTAPDGRVVIDTMEYFVTDTHGKWLGDETGNFISSNLQYRKNIVFPNKGNYRIKVEHGMRTPKLEGIDNLSVILRKDEQE